MKPRNVIAIYGSVHKPDHEPISQEEYEVLMAKLFELIETRGLVAKLSSLHEAGE